MTFALLDALRVENGRRWGDVATDVQRADALAVLDAQSATPYHWLGRARGWSKTSDLAAVALEVLLAQAPPGARLYGFGADRDQAGLLVDALSGFVYRGGPALQELLLVQASKIVVRATGASLEAMAADEASAWGLRPFFVVCDELPMWPSTRGARRLWEAVSSAVPKTGGRLVVAGTAGDPAHWSAKVREHSLEDPLWRVSETHGPAPWMDPALVEEQRRRLPESSFMRLFENVWTSGEDRLVAEHDLAACVALDGPQEPIPGMRYVIGLDVGLKHDRTVAAVCHLEHSMVVLDRMQTWQGSRARPVRLREVEEWLYEASRRYPGSIVFDPWQAMQLSQGLRSRGVSIVEHAFTETSVGRIASSLFVQLRDHALRLPNDEELLDELRNVRLRESGPGVLRLDHDSGRHDDRAVALALAVHRLIERGDATIVMRTHVTKARVAPESFKERHARRHGVGRLHPIDAKLAAYGIDSWGPDRGLRELASIESRARGSR
jgi:phage terminase large subunit-like protein